MVVAKSSDKCSGLLNGASAPNESTVSLISASSVDTKIRSNMLADCAAAIAHSIIGFPQKSLMFLRGIRFDPPRAGIIQIFILAPFREYK